MATEIETKIDGIPCRVRVTRYIPGRPAIRSGHPDTWTPPEGAEIEYQVLTRRGEPAQWLEAKITDADDEAICGLIISERVAA